MKRKIYTILDNCYTLHHKMGKPVLKFSKKFKQEFHHLARIASSEGLGSLSASQIGVDISMFVILQKGKLIPNKWKGYKVESRDYQVFCNPNIDKYSVQQIKQWEECPSIPGVRCLVSRSKIISASWTDEKDQTVEKQLSGFFSILFQHQFDHIQGRLITDRKISQGQIQPTEPMRKIMTEKDIYDIHNLKQNYKQILSKGQQLSAQLVNKYQKLMREVKYSIIERAIQNKNK